MQRIINFTYAALGVCFVVKISFFNERAVVHRDNNEGIILYCLLCRVLAWIAHSFLDSSNSYCYIVMYWFVPIYK